MSNDSTIKSNMNSESIKEKLHLHVKRRIQEQGSANAVVQTPSTSSSVQQSNINVRKQLFPSETPETLTSSVIVPNLISKSPKKNKTTRKQHVVPPSANIIEIGDSAIDLVISSGNGGGSNDTQTLNTSTLPSTIVPIPTDANKNISNNNDRHADLDEQCNAVLGIILNEKKNSLMKDPEVIKYLKSIYNKTNNDRS